MKTSEFIRHAVDAYLSDKHLELGMMPTRPNDTMYLCLAFNNARLEFGKKQEDQLRKAEQFIANILKDNGCVLDSSFYVVGSKAGYWKSRGECSKELQEIRFMLAEFMAHYFEDQGD